MNPDSSVNWFPWKSWDKPPQVCQNITQNGVSECSKGKVLG